MTVFFYCIIPTDEITAEMLVASVNGTSDNLTYNDSETKAIIKYADDGAGKPAALYQYKAYTLDEVHTVQATPTWTATADSVDVERVSPNTTKILGPSTGTAYQVSVPTTSTIIVSPSLTDRSGIVIKNNNGSGILYLGYTASEAAYATGFPLGPGETLGMDLAAGATIYGIASTGTIDARLMEAAS